MGGPLTGMRVVELEGRGPAPFGAMVLSDLGAEVVRITRPAPGVPADTGDTGDTGDTQRMISGKRRIDPVLRGRRTVAADLKDPAGLAAVRKLIDRADVLIEGYRPGVAERLGIGPGTCTERNPRLIYARITGWGQDGPLKDVPGHDINYIALAGVLDALPRGTAARDPEERGSGADLPRPPLNLLGDYGGGAMLLVTGILAALVERAVSGRGQVVDAAMTDGVALLTTLLYGMRAEGLFPGEPGTSVLGLDAPFYNVYETADGRHLTIGCGEPQFYARLLQALALPAGEQAELRRGQARPETWPRGKAKLAQTFKTKTLQAWRDLLEGTDTCFAPVLTLDEAPEHPHFQARGTFITSDGVTQPAPAPRFSRTPALPPKTTPPKTTAPKTTAPKTTASLTIDDVLRDWET